MKGKINNWGFLETYRRPYLAHQRCVCPFNAMNKLYKCGDWCALFGEPELFENEETQKAQWWLDLCHRNLIFDEFTDERNQKK